MICRNFIKAQTAVEFVYKPRIRGVSDYLFGPKGFHCFYVYFTGIQDTTVQLPDDCPHVTDFLKQQSQPPPKTDRASTILGIQKITRDPKTNSIFYKYCISKRIYIPPTMYMCLNKIKYTMLIQCDLKVKITPAIVNMALPSGITAWCKSLNKYLNDNFDTI